jgi:Na+/proline symporter
VLFYLIAQIVGAGVVQADRLPFELAVVIVGVLMISYVHSAGDRDHLGADHQSGLLLGGALFWCSH